MSFLGCYALGGVIAAIVYSVAAVLTGEYDIDTWEVGGWAMLIGFAWPLFLTIALPIMFFAGVAELAKRILGK